ncbi:MAG: glycoside hydrolase family 2 [Clostridia bacterium]|nr:glycoside hydrolase family 2 [Clostridia bacterium]
MKNDTLVTLLTAEGEALSGQPWNEYPRPQLKRDSFFCLNGEWDFYANNGAKETILVPYPPESVLSGIGRSMGKSPTVRYEKTFTLPESFKKDRVILHFGASDQITKVTLNGRQVGVHRGGYNAFSFDVTDDLQEENHLSVQVSDDLSSHVLPYGKQRCDRGGMWYTPVTGIWQSIWMESVPKEYVQSLKIDTGADFVKVTAKGVKTGEITVQTPQGEIQATMTDSEAIVRIPNARLWSPEDPYLYSFTLTSGEDRIESYFALRTLEVKTVDGLPRLCLNGKPYFFHGLLDQGYYSDGIYTPATPENYTRDVKEMKALGFNTLRKHIKVEPERFYYDCDRLGMIVFQDMVNNGHYSFLRDTALPTVGLKRLNDRWLHRDKATRDCFEQSMKATVEQLYNHPCICYWTIFNEGWGQFCSEKQYEALKAMDCSRFIDATSGWFRGKKSDVESLHVYFKPVRFSPTEKPTVLSEFGGYSYQPEGHVFHPGKPYGYRFFEKQNEFEDALIGLYENEIVPAVKKGLCGAIYTQVSDVEDETNGLLSYDRKVLKVSPERMRAVAEKLKI